MRSPLPPPTELIPEERIASIRTYLDRQSRIDLAVWVGHEQKSVDGPLYDHHLMLGMEDADYDGGHPDAILVAAVSAAVEDVPAVVRVELTRQHLWKGDREVWMQTRVFAVEDDARGSAGNVVKTMSELLAPFFPSNRGVSLGRSVDPGAATTTLFNRSGDRAS